MTTGFVSVGRRHLDVEPTDVVVKDYFGVSQLFRYSLAYCQKTYDQTLVLVPGHDWVLHPETPTPAGLNTNPVGQDLNLHEQSHWFYKIADQIRQYCPPESALFFHSGKWFEQLFAYLNQPDLISGSPTCYTIHSPMRDQHLRIGKQLSFYKSMVGQLPSIKNQRRRV